MHSIQCECGQLGGYIKGKGTSNRVVCFCSFCRAFAHYLGKQNSVLDDQGGTEILQVAQSRLVFTQGANHLAAMRLSEKGLVRWFASCCQTPIGNTLADPKMSFIGLIHSCLNRSQLEKDFGRKVALVNVDSALGEPKPQKRGMMRTISKFLLIRISSRLSGNYKYSPFFTKSGEFVTQPKVLSKEERQVLKKTSRI